MKRNIEEVFNLYQESGGDHDASRILALISLFTSSIEENSIVHPGYILSMVKQAQDVIFWQKTFIDLIFYDVQQYNIPAKENKHTIISP